MTWAPMTPSDPAIQIREATPDQYAEAGRVTAESYREFVGPGETAWEDYLVHIADVASRAAFTHVMVAVRDGRILGTATLEMDARVDREEDPPLAPGEAHIRMLGVDPAARGRGVARQLMATCEATAHAAGKTLMTLHTTSRMQVAQHMYETLGYVRGKDRVFPDGFVLLSYAKPLG
jgi:ribosomal protein S18 acetylase RimI-like enzyme